MMKPRKFRTFGGFIILIAILRSVTNQLGITPTHLFELGEAFCATVAPIFHSMKA